MPKEKRTFFVDETNRVTVSKDDENITTPEGLEVVAVLSEDMELGDMALCLTEPTLKAMKDKFGNRKVSIDGDDESKSTMVLTDGKLVITGPKGDKDIPITKAQQGPEQIWMNLKTWEGIFA